VRERRFLIDPADIEEGRAFIQGSELHHLQRVLRLRAGDEVSVFDGRGIGYRGRLEAIEASRAVVSLGEAEDPRVEPRVHLSLYQGIPHGERMDLIVEKATELGASRIVPVVSERSVVRPKAGGWGKLERLRRIAVAAAKQSGRLVVPEITEPVSFEEAIAAAHPAASTRVIFHTGIDAAPDLAEADRSEARPEVLVLVGPEGGFTDQEFTAASSSGWRGASLGARTLRADTAAVAALTLVLARSGEISV
jgi:16S rRNA (uracil1498-N3)-methyltransferase